jgi:hypothetical protein
MIGLEACGWIMATANTQRRELNVETSPRKVVEESKRGRIIRAVGSVSQQ